MNMLEEIMYSQLISIDSNKIIVKKDNKLYILSIECDEGDCCGYNSVEANLLIDDNNCNNNPIITNIEVDSNYSDDGDDYNDYCDSVKITFFGIDKQLATLESTSGSGSGWHYGANVSIICKDLNICETITCW